MGYDPFSPIALAQINVLCIPAARIKQRVFDDYFTWLKDVAAVQTRSSRSPSAESGPDDSSSPESNETSLLFHFSTSAYATDLLHPFFFEPYQRQVIILGFIDGSLFAPDLSEDDFFAILKEARLNLEQIAVSGLADNVQIQLLVFNSSANTSERDAIHISSLTRNECPQRLGAWLAEATQSALVHELESLRSVEVELPQSRQKQERSSSVDVQRDVRSDDNRRQSVLSSINRTPTQTPPLPDDSGQRASSGKSVSAALVKLQMGLWSEALEQFTDGARASRDINNPAWHAKALEGILICMLLLTWAGKTYQIPQNCYPTSRGLSSSSAIHRIADDNRAISEKFANSSTSRLQGLTAMLPGLLATIMGLYDRSTMGYDNALPQILVCEARIRLGKILAVVQKNGCTLNHNALEQLLGSQRTLTHSRQLESPSTSLVLRSSALGNLFIESIVEAQNQLPLQSASSVYLAVCQGLADLELERKQAFYLKDILQKLPPALVEARRVGSAEANRQSSVSGASTSTNTGVSQQKVAQGSRALLHLALKAYGLPDLYNNTTNTEVSESRLIVKRRLSSWLSLFMSGDIATKLEVVRLCIRVSDALLDLVGSVQFMSLLLFLSRQTVTVSKGVGNPVPLVSAEEQTRLANGIHNAVSAIQRLNASNASAQYWDDFLVRGIALCEDPGAGKLIPHSSQDLSHTTTSGTAKKDPFIYNPFSEGAVTSGPPVLVKGEVASFELTFQNPLDIEVEIETISLLTEGCAFESTSHNVLLGPLGLQVITVHGKPTDTGLLKITSCKAKIKDCMEQEFSIFTGTWKAPQTNKRKSPSVLEVDLPTSTTLELKVVDRLPQLKIGSSDLVQRSLMLLDGERSVFNITLENTGDIPADLVLFSYQDSVSRQVQDALATKDLQPVETYEFQHQLASKAIVKRVHEHDEIKHKAGHNAATVEADSKKVFEFEILGKAGLTEAVILIDYAHLGKPRNEIEGTFYTRQLRFVVNVTVNGSVDILRCNAMSIPTAFNSTGNNQSNGEEGTTRINRSASKICNLDPCLLQLDIRNIWQMPVTFTIETTTNESVEGDAPPEWEVATSTTLQPTYIERALILTPRIYIADPFAAIPSLETKRQYVVSVSKLTLEAEMASREVFWYREELCRRLRITWKEESGKRSGEIDVRKGIRLSARMVDALRVEHMQVHFDLKAVHAEDEGAVVRKGGSQFQVKKHVFATLVVTVENLTQEELKLLLRLQPSLYDQPHNQAMDLSKKFLWSGVLQQVLKGPLKPGESKQAELGIVVLASSTYEINATVEEIRSRRWQLEGALDIGSNAERRIWHARRPCLIDAVD